MKIRHKKKQIKLRKLAAEHVAALFREAKTLFKADSSSADSNIRKARRIAMKRRLKLGRQQKRQFCKHCYRYLVPSVNLRVRTNKGKIVYYCLSCKKYSRVPYK